MVDNNLNTPPLKKLKFLNESRLSLSQTKARSRPSKLSSPEVINKKNDDIIFKEYDGIPNSIKTDTYSSDKPKIRVKNLAEMMSSTSSDSESTVIWNNEHCISKVKLPQDNKLPTNEVINISSDEENILIKNCRTNSKKTPTKKLCPRKRRQPIRSKKKLILTEDSGKEKQTFIDTFFPKHRTSERIGYYNTFEESVQHENNVVGVNDYLQVTINDNDDFFKPKHRVKKFNEILCVDTDSSGEEALENQSQKSDKNTLEFINNIINKPSNTTASKTTNGYNRTKSIEYLPCCLSNVSKNTTPPLESNPSSLNSVKNCLLSKTAEPLEFNLKTDDCENVCTQNKGTNACRQEVKVSLSTDESPVRPIKHVGKLTPKNQFCKLTTPQRNVKKNSKKGSRTPTSCPSYKVIKGTNFAVDAFRFGYIEGITHYFLTHFHADHYIGLKKSFSKPIYLSEITAKLVTTFIKVSPTMLHIIAVNKPFFVEGTEITAIEANHCPGAVMFLFKSFDGVCTLHTGDFRASPDMEQEPIFWNNFVHTIYLDTTYLSNKYDFKAQSDSILDILAIVDDFKMKHIGEKILFVCGAYVIGKEKVWTKMAEENKFLVWTDGNRKKALETIGDPDITKLLTNDPRQAELHILNIGNLNYDFLSNYLSQYNDDFNILLAIRPSGWERNSKPQYRGVINIVGIEYSEHSSYNELRRFVRFLQPKKIISTVPAGSNISITRNVPVDWLNNPVRSKRNGYQTSITNFISMRSCSTSSKTSDKYSVNGFYDSISKEEVYSNDLSAKSDWLS